MSLNDILAKAALIKDVPFDQITIEKAAEVFRDKSTRITRSQSVRMHSIRLTFWLFKLANSGIIAENLPDIYAEIQAKKGQIRIDNLTELYTLPDRTKLVSILYLQKIEDLFETIFQYIRDGNEYLKVLDACYIWSKFDEKDLFDYIRLGEKKLEEERLDETSKEGLYL